MKRNNIENRLHDAIINLNTFIYILSFIPIFHKYQISNVISKNIQIIRHQTNFNEEVNNINKIKNNCNLLKYIIIPEVYSEITDRYPNFILMEYIHGNKISNIDASDYYAFSKIILKFGIITTLIHGAAHGDLHSGNILFIKDENDIKYPYKIGVIDFGLIYNIDPSFKNWFFDFIINLFKRTPEETVIKLINSGIVDPPNIINYIPKEHYENIISIGTNNNMTFLNSLKRDNIQTINLCTNIYLI
jgi:predicted unusual protein kinase regulating ubiquinone biosynthesis (AarF/ABC1/UbiB family)